MCLNKGKKKISEQANKSAVKHWTSWADAAPGSKDVDVNEKQLPLHEVEALGGSQHGRIW